MPSSPSYTLDDFRALATQYADTHEGVSRLSVQIMLSTFLTWLAKREQGKDG